MKRCPECRRDYFDDTLLYCLDDGTSLLEGPGSFDGPATAVLNTGNTGGNAPTRTFDASLTERTAVLPARTADYPANAASRKNLVITGLLGVLLLTVIGVGGFIYYGRAPSKQISSIAVLPFENRSGNADSDYLSDGLAESLIYRLSQLPDLKVSPTSSVMRYKGKESDIAVIAKELDVDAVMSGRLTQRGDSLLISVELVDARTNKLLWGEQYDRKMADLLATQREIATSIAQKLELKLAGTDAKGVTKRYTNNNEAYQLYLKGRFYFAKRTKNDIYKSIEIFQQAVKLDPSFALSFVGIAEAWTVIPSFPYASPSEAMPKAKAAADTAVEIDPDLPEAHTVLGMIAAASWDWAKAESEFKRSLELDPNLAITHYRYAWTYLSPVGHHDEAIAEMKIAMDKEPLNLIQGANFAGVLIYARRFDEAVEQAKKTYDLDPDFFGGKNWLCHAYNMKGMYAEALAVCENSPDPDVPFLAATGYAYTKLGQLDKAANVMIRWREESKRRYVINYWVAVNYAALGDKDAAFVELEKAYAAHDWFLQRIKTDPFLDPLRDDPRFDELVRRLRFPV
ncbi:MAG: tetratricopeptide repeat protein [Acidobacteriota bacterium]